MKFIYADCMDLIDPEYDFMGDCHSEKRVKYWGDQFAHEYLDRPPYDGILVSRGVVGDHISKGKYSETESMRFRREGGRTFLRYTLDRFPGSLLFGDCGAFQYVKQDVPPYSADEMVEFYADGGFTHGCSIDHIIFEFNPLYDERRLFDPRIPDDAKRRYEITLDLAEKFLKAAQKLGSGFTPLGVVQGWSPKSMATAAQALVGMGYTYLAIGGLVPLRAEDIHLVLSAIRNAVRPEIRLHLLGFAKADQLPQFLKYDITSFDTSSPMIRAFKDGTKNYFLPDGRGILQYFKAIRIPQALENNTLKKKIKTGRYSQEELITRETRALCLLREYAKNGNNLEDTLNAVRHYSEVLVCKDENTDQQNSASLDLLMKQYHNTLVARPWEHCRCRVCREAGVEVIIFRSSNRNKRRGMHNLAVFYDYLNRLRDGN